jgi:hypothetical protein
MKVFRYLFIQTRTLGFLLDLLLLLNSTWQGCLDENKNKNKFKLVTIHVNI